MVKLPAVPLLLLPSLAVGAHMATTPTELSHQWVGTASLIIFIIAILLVSFEEFIRLRKSKPMLLAAGMIWALIGLSVQGSGASPQAEAAVRHSLLQYAELMLFMLVVMTYINAMTERRVFVALRSWMSSRRYSYRQLFWLTGVSTFFLSPFLDNLSTALLMGAVVMAVGRDNPRFVSLACVNVVIASNAGGAYSPFGDITTLMVWQQDIMSTNGRVGFFSFFSLFIPSVVNYLIPALFMHLALPEGRLPNPQEPVVMLRGARRIIGLFLLTIATAVCFQGLLYLPAVIGVLTGLSYLQFFGYYLKKTHKIHEAHVTDEATLTLPFVADSKRPFDVFLRVARAEWDTLLFLCGVILSVGGLGYLGLLSLASEIMYGQWGPTITNIAVGLSSSVLENIPTMSAVLAMSPEMSMGQWLLVTLAAGVGGSLLSIGSAAGIALMGQSGGRYTFFGHLKWAPAIALGYAASILTHLWINSGSF
ncbi:MAG: sodium:proton antiporter NhaD [Pseudomonadota bacterium]